MREAKEMMNEVADAIDDIKNDRPGERAGEGSQSAERKMRRYRRFAEKTISAIDALFQQPLDLQTLAGLPKALAAKMQELIDSLPGIRECAGDAGTLIEHAESLFDAITSSVAEATRQRRDAGQSGARHAANKRPDVSQLAATDITRSL